MSWSRKACARAKAAIGVADLTIVLLDRSRPLTNDDRELLGVTRARPRVVVWNKIDLPPSQPIEPLDPGRGRCDFGGDGRRARSFDRRDRVSLGAAETLRDRPQVTNVRHTMLLERAREALTPRRRRARVKDLRRISPARSSGSRRRTQEITGKRTTDDLLRHIFERFCIGK